MTLASASNDYTVRLWDVATGGLTRTLQAIDNVAAVAFAPDGRSLAAADEKGMVTMWDVDSGARLQSMAFEHDFPLCLAYSPDGRSLAVAGKTRTIRLWDPVTGQELLSLRRSQSPDQLRSPSHPTARPSPRAATTVPCGSGAQGRSIARRSPEPRRA